MALKYSTDLRNAQANAIAQTVPRAVLELRTGAAPANPLDPDAGELVVNIVLPDNWLGDAVDGEAANTEDWKNDAEASGKVGHFRIKAAGNGLVHMQGSVGKDSGDLRIQNTSIEQGQTVTVKRFAVRIGQV